MTNGSLASHLYSMFSSPLRCMLLVLFFLEYNEEQCIVFMNFMPTDALFFVKTMSFIFVLLLLKIPEIPCDHVHVWYNVRVQKANDILS